MHKLIGNWDALAAMAKVVDCDNSTGTTLDIRKAMFGYWESGHHWVQGTMCPSYFFKTQIIERPTEEDIYESEKSEKNTQDTVAVEPATAIIIPGSSGIHENSVTGYNGLDDIVEKEE